MLTFISRRLGEVSGNITPFGGFNIILFGDFFSTPSSARAVCFSQSIIMGSVYTNIFERERETVLRSAVCSPLE